MTKGNNLQLQYKLCPERQAMEVSMRDYEVPGSTPDCDTSATQKRTRLMFMKHYAPNSAPMLVHKGGQINNVQSITGVGSAEMSHLQNCIVKIFKEHCRYFTQTSSPKGNDRSPENKQVFSNNSLISKRFFQLVKGSQLCSPWLTKF